MAGIQKIGQGIAKRPWGAARRTGQADAEASRLARLDAAIVELTAQLIARSVTRADDREAGYAAAVELVASVFSARSVTLLLPESDRPNSFSYRAVASSRDLAGAEGSRAVDSETSSNPTIELDLTSVHPLRSALESGLACEANGDSPLAYASPLWDAASRASRWQAASRRLLLPCVGPPEAGADRLLGILVVEGGFGARDWTKRFIARASAAATNLATFLERARLARELDEIRAERQRAARLEGLGEVARSVAHDFNNLLTAIQGYADLAELEMSEQAAGRESLLEIQNAASRAARLVDEILRYESAPAPEAALHHVALPSTQAKDVLDVAAILADLSGLVAHVAGPKVEVRIDVDADLPRIRVDRDAFDRMILNLVANARDAIAETNRSGRVEIEASAVRSDAESGPLDAYDEDAFVRVSVSDDGSGLRECARARLFERGFTTKPPGRGHGLGLSGAAEIMRACGGRVRVESRSKSDAQTGTVFHLDFPIG